MRRIGGKLPLNAESGLESIKRLVDRLHEGQNFFGNFRGSGRMIQRAMTMTGSLPLFKNLLRTLLKRVSVSRRQVASFPAETPANCGLSLRDRETSVRIGLPGGAGRTQTSNQTVMSWKDSNLNQAVMSEPLRLRKRVIFPPTGRKDAKYLPGMQFCRTSLRRGQVRGAEGREPLDEPK